MLSKPANSLETWVDHILGNGNLVLNGQPYGITLQKCAYGTCTSPDGKTYVALSNDLVTYAKANYFGWDMVVLLTGQAKAGVAPGIGYTPADKRCMIINVAAGTARDCLYGLFQHEESHVLLFRRVSSLGASATI